MKNLFSKFLSIIGIIIGVFSALYGLSMLKLMLANMFNAFYFDLSKAQVFIFNAYSLVLLALVILIITAFVFLAFGNSKTHIPILDERFVSLLTWVFMLFLLLFYISTLILPDTHTVDFVITALVFDLIAITVAFSLFFWARIKLNGIKHQRLANLTLVIFAVNVSFVAYFLIGKSIVFPIIALLFLGMWRLAKFVTLKSFWLSLFILSGFITIGSEFWYDVMLPSQPDEPLFGLLFGYGFPLPLVFLLFVVLFGFIKTQRDFINFNLVAESNVLINLGFFTVNFIQSLFLLRSPGLGILRYPVLGIILAIAIVSLNEMIFASVEWIASKRNHKSQSKNIYAYSDEELFHKT